MALRRIKSAKITTIALCPRGANLMPVLYKEEGGAGLATFESLSKASADLGELLNVVYAPNRPDADGDFADGDTIKQFAHEFNRDHRQLDLRHDGKILTKEQAFVAESFIIAKGDERFLGWKDTKGADVGDLTGAWATVIKINDPVLRDKYRSGGWNGVSMSGPAVLETVSAKSADERAFEGMADLLGRKEQDTMTPEQMALLSKSIAEAVVAANKADRDAANTAAITAAAAAKATDPNPRPMLTGDIQDPEVRAAYTKSLKTWEINKALADGTKTADEVATLLKSMDEVAPTDAEAGVEATDAPEVRLLKQKLFKAQKRTNQPAAAGAPTTATLTKAEQELKEENELGSKLAKSINEGRGFKS